MKGGSVILRANPDGTRTVSKKEDKSGEFPVIDIESADLLALFEGMTAVRLVQRDGEIHLLPLATEIRRKERLNRVRNKVLENKPLEMGSASHGGGLLADAVSAGLSQSGLTTHKRFANDIRPELLEHAETVSDNWDSKTMIIAAPMQEFAFDDAAMRHLPRVEVFEAGFPCSGASPAGTSKRKLKHPEEHPEVGHLAVAGLMIIAKANPAALILENVPRYGTSASAAQFRNQLRDLGYETFETVLQGSDFNCLEHRDRWCMVAVTKGMHFDWSMLQLPEKETLTLSDVFDPISENDPMWKEMLGLKAKQERDIADGKGFMMQTYSGESTKINTITKGYAKIRSTDPKIKHPTNPDLLRQLTANEHARIKQFPEGIIRGLSNTLAHEILGQGIIRNPFIAVSKAVGESIINYAYDRKPSNLAALIEGMAIDLEETAALTVSEVRAPLAGVKYEGPVSINENGMVIQDMGGGVGILHRADALQNVKLGEVLRVQYSSVKSTPVVDHLSHPAPAQTADLMKILAQDANQRSLFEPETSDNGTIALEAVDSPEIAAQIVDIYKPNPSIYKGPSM